MAFVLQEFTVADFVAFKALYLDDLQRRQRLGAHGGRVFHVIGDEHEVTVLIEFGSTANALQFAGSIGLQEAVKWASTSVVPHKTVVLEELLSSEA